MQKKLKKEKWTEQELDLLAQLYPLYNSKKWKQIATAFRQHGFHREKWINYLDPELNTNEWGEEQLARMYQIHQQVGTKWCVIQKYIGRTQNKIKNRFYGTLRNYVRFVINYLQQDERSYNYEVGKLSPKFLNDMYRAQNQFTFLKEQIKDTIYQMKFQIDRNILSQRISSKQNLYNRLKMLILKAFAGFKVAKKYLEKVSSDVKIEGQIGVKEQPPVQSIMEISNLQQFDEQAYQPIPVKQQQIHYAPNYYPFWNFPYQQYGLNFP